MTRRFDWSALYLERQPHGPCRCERVEQYRLERRRQLARIALGWPATAVDMSLMGLDPYSGGPIEGVAA